MDDSAFRWVNRLADRTGWAHGPLVAYAKYGIGVFGLLLVVSYVDARNRSNLRALAGTVWAGAAALVALGLGQLVGGIVDRARPYETLTGIHLLIDRTSDFSFPSDHATAVGAVAAGLWFANRRWGAISVTLALVMAFSRVYVGAHFPGDVIVGVIAGASVAALGRVIAVPLLTRLGAVAGRSPLGWMVGPGVITPAA